MNKNILSVWMILLIVQSSTWAQNLVCSQRLKEANTLYDNGKAEDVPVMLAPCLEQGFDRQEKIEAYKLLVLSYVFLDEKTKAEDAMLQFLRLEPEYQISSIDPPEFINLYKLFRTTPIYLIGFKAGGNLTDVNVQKNFSLDQSNVARGEYNFSLGYQIGLALEIPFNKNLSLTPEIYLYNRSYVYKDILLDFAYLDYKEVQNSIDLPILAKYTFLDKGWRPFVKLGGTLHYIINADATAIRTDFVDTETQREVSGPSISMLDQRKALNYSIIVGGGVQVKNLIGRSTFLIEGRFQYGLSNIVKVSERGSNSELIYEYGYLDDDFSFNTFSLSIGLLFPKYKPRKIKEREGVSYSF